MTTTREAQCLDCTRITMITDWEPPENQRCIGCFIKHLEANHETP